MTEKARNALIELVPLFIALRSAYCEPGISPQNEKGVAAFEKFKKSAEPFHIDCDVLNKWVRHDFNSNITSNYLESLLMLVYKYREAFNGLEMSEDKAYQHVNDFCYFMFNGK